MGIYPTTKIEDRAKHADGTETWTEVYNDFSGVIRRRQVTAAVWIEDPRDTCFCCSCSEWGTDPHCRNHGFDGQRPCEQHNMPGAPGLAGKMPHSVQAERAHNHQEVL